MAKIPPQTQAENVKFRGVIAYLVDDAKRDKVIILITILDIPNCHIDFRSQMMYNMSHLPYETVRLDVRLENETVWLTQEQIANLFGTKRPAITKHLANIYKSGELERDGTCSILEHMGNDGKQSYRTMFYNLDAILSVGLGCPARLRERR